MKCRLCQNLIIAKSFKGKILGKFINYLDCIVCGYVQTENPTWLPKAYASNINDSDTGVMSRNLSNISLVTATLSLMRRKKSLIVDYAGGPQLSSDEKLLVRSFLSSRFEHLNNITNQELNILHNHAYCLAYPSAYEGFGMPILEAMRSGCPVIARNCSSIPEAAGEGAFLLQTNDIDELVNAFIELKNDYKRENFRQKGFEQAKKFTWQKCCQETISVHERIMRRSF